MFRREVLAVDTLPPWMMSDHFKEVGLSASLAPAGPRPDWAYYARKQQRGQLLFVAARTLKGMDIVGYAGALLKPHPHYKDILACTGDLHYLMPAYRGAGNGGALLDYLEEQAFELGAKIFIQRTKAGRTEHGYLFEKRRYVLTDLVYIKDLRDAPA